MQVCLYSVNMNFTDFATNLRRLRALKRLSQAELGRQLGHERQTIYAWEKGNYHPRTDQLVPLADALGCTVDELVRPVKEAS